ncbi:MAG: gliding motility-associated ABC transporter ATP-binding subunit GldA [Cryomorphaceae bacterium]|nr:gliding motility-associated ABC transporter ATP-binding subunit GldA [Cryomorphaceae bacterium]
MSIQVTNVVKTYGEQRALNDVSFSISSGEVVGFLGPNGAGKSTMMKIITCYLTKTSGEVSVCGYDVEEDPLEVKRRVGYLPENNPLYLDMYVKEFLTFIAGINKTPKARVAEMIEITGLGPEQHKKIKQLSKGYRQRVGLAQAIIHDPEVLILDEPTTGLDPNQLVEIRGLIKSLGKEKTVMLSTHIMQEVEMLCDRVIIINKGRILTDQPVEKLRQATQSKAVLVRFTGTVNTSAIRKLPGVLRVKKTEKGLLVESEKDLDLSGVLFKYAVDNKLSIEESRPYELGLEEVFRTLTANT